VRHKLIDAIESRKYLLIGLFTAIYALGAVARASGKPFWYDEVITLIAARAPDLASVWKVTLAVDANPPLPHLLTHLSIRWFGLNEVSARLPAIVGFWVLCLSLYGFVARRKGVVFGLCALLLPVLTHAYFYSAEARAYGLELGFCGLALIFWQKAAERRHRAIALCGLALSLIAAMFCHYYAVLVYLPLAGGEWIRARRLRRPDWGMWIALAAGVVPLVWRATTIVGVVKGFSHTWSPAYLRQGLEYWAAGLAPGAAFAALLLVALALVARRRLEPPDHSEQEKVPEHEWMAAVLLMAVPLAGVIGGLLVTHIFNDRYALIGLAGFCLLAPMVAAELLGTRGIAGGVMLAVLAWGMAIRSMDHPSEGNPFAGEPVLREALEQGPVVIPDGLLFMQMWHYAPERLKSRLIYVADDQAALKYMGFEAFETGIRVLRAWAPVNVMEWGDFTHNTREFVAYQTLLRPGWVLERVVEEGATVEVRKTTRYRELVKVRLRD
jgi:hypothetical protein